MLKLEHVSFSYPNGEGKALDDISFEFEMGKCYCLEGPNGCGKSTLFRILLGLDFPDEGTYTAFGEEITAVKMKKPAFAAQLHRRIGFIFQNSEIQLFTGCVAEELAFGLEQMHLPEEKINEKVSRYLKRFDLEHLRSRAPFALSGGEKKRTALASVLIMEPEVLVMDEPLAGLDEEGMEWVTEFILEEKKPDRLMIVATHNRELADRIADVHVRMDKNHRIIG